MATKNYVLSYILWTLARLVILALCGVLLYRFLLSVGWDTKSAWLGLSGCLLFFPIFISLLGGQDTVFMLAGLMTWMFALLKGKDIPAGLGLAFASLMPTIAGALTLPVLAARRRAGFWFLAGTGGLAAYSFLVVGVQGIRDFIHLLLITSQARAYGFTWTEMYNLLGILTRAMPALNVDLVRAIGWGAAFLAILVLSIWWWKEQGQLTIRHIGIAVLAVTFVSPHLYLHTLSVLMIPMLGFMTLLWERGCRADALLFLPAVSTGLMLIVMLAPEWIFAACYALMAILAYGLWRGLPTVRKDDKGSAPA